MAHMVPLLYKPKLMSPVNKSLDIQIHFVINFIERDVFLFEERLRICFDGDFITNISNISLIFWNEEKTTELEIIFNSKTKARKT